MSDEFVDYYELLGIDQNATEEEIHKAVRNTRRRFRQLSGSPDQDKRSRAEKVINQLAEAEKILGDAAARQRYDANYAQASAAAQQQEEAQQQGPSASGGDFLEDAKRYYRAGQMRNAIYAAKEATQVRSDDPEAWSLRASIDLDIEDYGDADFSVNQALRYAPHNPVLYDMLGTIANKEQRYADAIEAYNKAVLLEPNDGYFPTMKAMNMFAAGQHDQSLDFIRQTQQKFPDDKFVKVMHVSILLDMITWIQSNDASATRFWYANTKQIAKGREYLAEIDAQGPVDDSDLTANIRKAHEELETAAKRGFRWPGVKLYVGLFVLWFIVGMILGNFGSIGNLLVFVFAFVCLGIAFVKTFPYGWERNKEQGGNSSLQTGLQ